MMPTLSPDLVIFDCDGVLVDSEPATFEVLVDDLARYGLPLSHAEAEELFIGGTMAGVGRRATALGARLPDDWLDAIYARVYDRLRRGVPEIAGVRRLVEALHARGTATAVGSNGSLEKMEITLGGTGLAALFEGRIFSAHAHGTAKPDPALFLLAADRAGVAPGRCVVVDDSPTGCRAARAAGMACIGFAAASDPDRLAAEGATPVRTMTEAAALLGISL